MLGAGSLGGLGSLVGLATGNGRDATDLVVAQALDIQRVFCCADADIRFINAGISIGNKVT